MEFWRSCDDRIREAFRGPTRRANVEKRFVDLKLHQDEPPVTLDPVDAGIEQGLFAVNRRHHPSPTAN